MNTGALAIGAPVAAVPDMDVKGDEPPPQATKTADVSAANAMFNFFISINLNSLDDCIVASLDESWCYFYKQFP
jgi:hypothetical protein